MTQPPPGWYPDQADPRYLRWWDGYRWTPYTQPVPQPQSPQQQYPPQQYPQPQYPQAFQYEPRHPAAQQPQGGQPQHSQQHPHYPQQPAQQASQPAPQQPAPQQSAPQQPARQQPGLPYQGGPQHQVAPQSGPAAHAGAAQGGAAPGGAAQAGAAAQLGAGPVYTAQALHIVQDKRLFVGMLAKASYAVTDHTGTPVGAVVQVNPDESKHVRTYSDDGGGAGLSQHFELVDLSGAPYFHVARALRAQSAAKPRFDVTLPDGTPLGHVESEKLVGRITLGLYVGGVRAGQLKMGGMRNTVLNLTDAGGQQIVECERKPPMFSREDAYNLTRPYPTPEPLGTMVLAGIIAVDNAFFAKSQASLF
ncbi:hypothetical protein GCM10009676_24570 [Prauserella halophila]|uniref:DUF2510 domain-containing protein n=1 Tax=Prauserella halophila TaxID=185641 RepID=A0ABN1W7M0_9PSEU|nr:DUF2510 domain-containing protein [Prauserella halophila]MCP2234842.1 Protein of unknown function (DUF2510) [Prauserella halophila]